MDVNEEAIAKVKVAENRVTGKAAKAAAQFLSAMQAQGKTGADMPIVLSAFWKRIGGQDQFGDMLGEQFLKAQGKELTPDEMENWRASPKMVKDWFELAMRHIDRADANKTLSVESLEEADLESILADVGRRAIMEDAELRRAVLWMAIRDDKQFRKMAFMEIARQDKSLVDNLLRNGGIVTLEASEVEFQEPTNNTLEEDSTVDDYDPSEDEYKD